ISNNMSKTFKIEKEDSTWVEIKPIELTEVEVSKLRDPSKRKAAAEAIKSRMVANAIKKDSDAAKAVYEAKKPKLKETDTYELVDANITIDGDKARGIINAWINGKFTQTRF